MPNRVLVVDDDPILRAIVLEILSGHDLDCAEAADGRLALEMLQRQAFDLVVLDMLMPGKDGVEVITALRDRWPAIRILAISGGGGSVSSDNLLNIADAMGADAVMEKPLRQAGFLECVLGLLAKGGERLSAN